MTGFFIQDYTETVLKSVFLEFVFSRVVDGFVFCSVYFWKASSLTQMLPARIHLTVCAGMFANA